MLILSRSFASGRLEKDSHYKVHTHKQTNTYTTHTHCGTQACVATASPRPPGLRSHTSSAGRILDGDGLFPWRQAPGQVRPGDDLHLLGGDVVVEDGLPRGLHGVQLVGVGVARWCGLPGEDVRAWAAWDEDRRVRWGFGVSVRLRMFNRVAVFADFAKETANQRPNIDQRENIELILIGILGM